MRNIKENYKEYAVTLNVLCADGRARKKKCYTISSLAEILDYGSLSIYKWIWAGLIPKPAYVVCEVKYKNKYIYLSKEVDIIVKNLKKYFEENRNINKDHPIIQKISDEINNFRKGDK